VSETSAKQEDRPQRVVLIVEDTAADRLEYRRLIEEGGREYTVLEAETGQEGLDMVRRERPDCVLLDYNLPDMDGGEFLHALADGRAGTPAVPVAILTGRDDTRVAQESLKSGAQDYVLKGTLTGAGFVRVIENTIEKHAIRHELERKRAALEMRTWQLELAQDELQRKVSELATATRAKDQFVAVMSHEMRTPLNAILGYTELLEMGVGGGLDQGSADYIRRIRTGGKHLLDLINDVLDLSRAEAEEVELSMDSVDPVAVAEEVTHLLEREAAQRDLPLVLETPAEPVPHARADLRRVRQILTNLLGNAIKFTDEGAVTVSIEARDGTVAIHVRDSGIGISPEVLPLVFDRFYQADGTLTRERGGSGLGLAIAQRLARLMGGDIEAHSDLGQGSRFTLLLPTAEAAAGATLHQPGEDAALGAAAAGIAGAALHDAAGAADAADAAGAAGAVGTMLAAGAAGQARGSGRAGEDGAAVAVVAYSDDEEALRSLEEHVAPTVRLHWTTATDRVRDMAIQAAAGLVVLDISSAGGTAWAAAHSLQDVPELASTAVLLLPTIPPPGPEPSAALDLGWVSLVPKPFTEEQLTRAVSRAAGQPEETEPGAEQPAYEVLVVDDDAESRHVARSFLERAGLRVREVEDGESALVSMRYRRPDVVVLDLMMPVLDGFGVLAAMRADSALANLPVVVLSAKSLTEAERRFLVRSAVRVLQKGQHRLADVAALVVRAAERSTG